MIVKLVTLLEELLECEITDETLFLVELLSDMIDFGYVNELTMEEYFDEMLQSFEITFEIVDATEIEVDDFETDIEDLDEAIAKKSRVVRGNKKKTIFQCPAGFKKVVAGGKKCKKIKPSDTLRRSRRMKKTWRTKIKRKMTRIKIRRKRSLRKRRTWHN